MSEKVEYDADDISRAQQAYANIILKGLLRNLTEVRNQQAQGTGRGAAHRNGVVDGLNIAISAVRRRVR